MAEDEKFVSRWARRKAESRQASAIDDDLETPVAGPDEVDGQTALAEDPEVVVEDPDDHPALGIDIEKLDYDSDFTVFMHEKVPQALKRQALRRLWASNPILANVDGLNDYDEDFTDAATVVEGLKAAYDEACARRKAKEDAEAARTARASRPDEEPEEDAEQEDAEEGDGDAAVAETSETQDAVDVADGDIEDEELDDGTDEA